MRWPPWRKPEPDPAPYDPRLSWSEAESLHSLLVAASTAEDLKETDLRDRLLKEADLILRRGTQPPCIASVHSLPSQSQDSSSESGKK